LIGWLQRQDSNLQPIG